MSYKYTQYIYPKKREQKDLPSDNYKKNIWNTDYTTPKNVYRCLDIEWHSKYKYAGPRNGWGVHIKKEKFRPKRLLYKEDRVERYRKCVVEYTLPKSFVEEHKYRDIRL
jgi:hypothetical protein